MESDLDGMKLTSRLQMIGLSDWLVGWQVGWLAGWLPAWLPFLQSSLGWAAMDALGGFGNHWGAPETLVLQA